MRTAGHRAVPAAAAAAATAALFFGGGFDDDALAWIGAIALAGAALTAAAALTGLLPAPRLDAAAGAFLGCLAGLAAWVGASTWWSISPDRSWGYTNRTLVYLAFALLGVLLGGLLPQAASRVAAAAAVLLGAVLGWALLVKCVPALYPDYGRVARLRAPLGYWNELALLCAAAAPIALWIAAPRRNPAVRAAGVLLLFAALVALLLTYSRFGVVLACAAAAGWLLLERDRVEGLVAAVLAGGAAAAVFAVALALPGIAKDGQPRPVRVHDGWIFALLLVAAGGAVFAVALALARLEVRRPLAASRRRTIERVAGRAAVSLALAGLAVGIVFAGRIWKEFANPVSTQIGSQSSRYLSASSSNRWRWWGEEWRAFTAHPFGGTGAGTFELTDRRYRVGPLVTTAPHNVPLQFLGETGIVGFLLFVGAVAAAAAGIVRARRRAGGAERAAATALGVGLAAFVAHMVVDMDWNFVATCGPLLLVAGVLLGRPGPDGERVRVRRPLLAAGAVLLAAAAVYSLAAPWLARRALAAANPQRAHAYNPLSARALVDWAAFEDARGNVLHALQLNLDAVALEPQSSETWYALGDFYWQHRAWRRAYDAYSKAWTYDRFGPAGIPCGRLDQARHRVTGRWAPSCPGGRRASSP